MLQFHEISGSWIRKRVVLSVPNLFDSHLHLEPSILLDYCKVKPLEYYHFDT